MTMKTRTTRVHPFLPYIAMGGLLILLIDVYLKLQNIDTNSINVKDAAQSVAKSISDSVSSTFTNESSSSVLANEDASSDRTVSDKSLTSDDEGPCQEFILYYKPPKTGSTAVTDAARWYVATQGHSDYRCGLLSCGPYAEGVCSGRLESRQLLGHLSVNFSTVDCLKAKNYYVATSNREPMERWRSAYRYNIQHKASHYGIPWQVNYKEWMARVPPCVLLNYYDGKGRQCGDDVDERIEKIVSMVDEVVDLYEDEHKGELHKKIEPFLGESNVSDVGNRTIRYPDLPKEIDARLDPERKLYKALKERSKLPPAEGRRLCVRDIKTDEEEDVEG